MPPIRLPDGRIVFFNSNIGDVVIDLSNYPDMDDTIQNEDVQEIGTWSDYSGSGGKPGQQVMMGGISDVDPETLQGQLIDSELNLSDRGTRKGTSRERPRLITIQT